MLKISNISVVAFVAALLAGPVSSFAEDGVSGQTRGNYWEAQEQRDVQALHEGAAPSASTASIASSPSAPQTSSLGDCAKPNSGTTACSK